METETSQRFALLHREHLVLGSSVTFRTPTLTAAWQEHPKEAMEKPNETRVDVKTSEEQAKEFAEVGYAEIFKQFIVLGAALS